MTSSNTDLFRILGEVNRRPAVFSAYTAETLWNDPHISKNMLAFHLDGDSEPASRPREFIERSAGWIGDRFGLADGIRVADFGCGPGLYTSRFAGNGARVTGIDFSERSINHARNEAEHLGLDIEYIKGNYLDLQTDSSFDLITLIYCDLCALSPDQRRTLLGIFSAALADGGSILFDVFTLNAYQARQEETEFGHRLMGGFWSSGDYWGFKNVFRYDDVNVALDKYVIVEPHQTREVYNWLQYYSIETLAAELEACGLRIVERYADVAGSHFDDRSDVVTVVAEKM